MYCLFVIIMFCFRIYGYYILLLRIASAICLICLIEADYSVLGKLKCILCKFCLGWSIFIVLGMFIVI